MDLWEVWDGLNLENQLYRARGVVALVAPTQYSTVLVGGLKSYSATKLVA